MEFDDGGNTIWIHGPKGATVLRIKAGGRIKVNQSCENICTHADLEVKGDIEICLVPDSRESDISNNGESGAPFDP